MVMFVGIVYSKMYIIIFLCDIIWNIIILLLMIVVGIYLFLKSMRKYIIFYDFYYVFEIWYNVVFSFFFNID